MTLRHLEVFIAVVDCKSMRSAAEKLYISQPSVSGAIAELEQEFDVLLFERIGRGLKITPQGLKMANYARQMLNLSYQMQLNMSGSEGKTPLRIGATVTVGTYLLQDIIKNMPNPTPYVFIHNTEEIVNKIISNELDIAIVEGEITSKELNITPVMKDTLVLACPQNHPLTKNNTINIQKLENTPLLMREHGSGTRKLIEDAFNKHNVTLTPVWECSNTHAIINGIKNGFGLGIMSTLICKDNGLATIEITGCKLDRNFSLIYHKDKFISSQIENFINLSKA